MECGSCGKALIDDKKYKKRTYCSRECLEKAVRLSQKGRARGVLKGMRQRCRNKKNRGYCYYGARGIECLWNTREFIEWYCLINNCEVCGKKVNSGQREKAVDRIDVNGNYEKGNCRIVCPGCNIKEMWIARPQKKQVPIWQIICSGC